MGQAWARRVQLSCAPVPTRMYSRVICGIDRERHAVIGISDFIPKLVGFVWHGLALGLAV